MEYPAVIGRVLEFLEVVFHTILAVRNVYPSESFTKARKYDLVVRKSRHPGLCSYISDFLAGIKEDCIKGVVDRVMLVIVDEGFNPVQKYVFRIRDVMEQLTFESKKSSVTTVTDLALEEYFRDILTKISFSQSSLADNPPDCTFQLYCELQKHVDHPSSYLKGVPWVLAESSAVLIPYETDGGVAERRSSFTPYKTLNAGVVKFSFFLEQPLKK